MKIHGLFDERTFTLTYVVADPTTGDALIIDPVLDYEPAGSRIFTESIQRVSAHVQHNALTPRLILETHAHADHLSGAQVLKQDYPDAPVGIGAEITRVQQTFKPILGLPEDFPVDGSQFDRLLADGEQHAAGSITIQVIRTPGHTPACVSYLIGDALFTGDALFMPDSGTGRCDFPGGSAEDLYTSITERIHPMADHTRVFVGHDYQPGGRELKFCSTVGDQRLHNRALPAGRERQDFVAWREARDATLSAPRLLYQSIQVNLDAGRLPPPGPAGQRYLKIPIQ